MNKIRITIIVLLLALFFLIPNIFITYTDYLWFLDTGYRSVFIFKIWFKAVIFIAAFIFVFLLAYLNVRPSFKKSELAPVIPIESAEKAWHRYREILIKFFSGIFTGVCLVLALIQASSLAARWKEIALFLNMEKSGISVPVFDKDVSFYLFRYPFYSNLLDWLLGTFVFVFILVALAYFLRSVAQTVQTFKLTFSWFRRHFYGLLAFILIIVSAKLYLGSLGRAYSGIGTVTGATYTDVNYLMPALKIFSGITILLSLYLIYAAFSTIKWKQVLAASSIFVVLILVGIYIVPGIFHTYVVSPSELSRERPYIKNHISMTRMAYDLDKFKSVSFSPSENLTYKAVEENPETIENIRLWDRRPLLSTYNQLQTIRSYYYFNDIDFDRYEIDGELREVAISAREMSTQNLSEKAKTWVNLHLKYTHGYGVTANFINSVTNEGLPEFIIKDLPINARFEVIEIEKPQIYFGELTNNYVIVDSKEKEFDYPAGDENVYKNFQGETGIKLDSYLKKVAFSYRFGTLKIILSEEVSDDSKMFFDRNILKRARKIAPFLKYDRDPYPVIVDGKIYWILDGYFSSNYFPYSEPINNGRMNYLRNSVKVVIDSYDGSIDFYKWDKDDPLLKAYSNIFPELFKPREDIPEDIEKHFRYPEDYFRTQANMNLTYHMTDPGVFYNQEDKWEVAQEIYADKKIPVEPYYVIMELSSSAYEFKGPEFLIMQPFTPKNKNNLMGWMFVSSDMPNYGKGAVFKFEKGSLAYGPLQIESRIDQSSEISQQITLWNQSGSRVIRGNLLVFPFENGVLYVEPMYLQAEQSKIPELKRVIVASREKVVMGESLDGALAELFGRREEEEKRAEKGPAGTESEIITKLKDSYSRLEEALKSGNFAKFGEILSDIKGILFGQETTETTDF